MITEICILLNLKRYILSHPVMLKQSRSPAHLGLSFMHVPTDLQGMMWNKIYTVCNILILSQSLFYSEMTR